MFDIVQKLLMARELEMKEGEISLLGERVQFVPTQIFVDMLKSAKTEEEYWKVANLQYESTKKAVYEWFQKMSKKKGLVGNKLLEWEVNIWNLAGWGNFSFNATQFLKGRVSCRVKNSPIAKIFLKSYGKSKWPVCHLIRGGLAGGMVAVTGIEESEVIETKCMAQGYDHCEFIIRPKEEFKDLKKPYLKKQINL